jgi:hypothetical protein
MNKKIIHSQKINEYFKMRENLSALSDNERRSIEKKSGKLFSEIVELGAELYPSRQYSRIEPTK